MAKHNKVGADRNSKKNRREKLKDAAKKLLSEKHEEIEVIAEPVIEKGGKTKEEFPRKDVYIAKHNKKFVVVDVVTNERWANEYFKDWEEAKDFISQNKLNLVIQTIGEKTDDNKYKIKTHGAIADRIKWEDDTLYEIEVLAEMSRGDAQGLVEADKGERAMNEAFEKDLPPKEAAAFIWEKTGDDEYAKGGITLAKVGDKVEEFVSKADDSVTYFVHKYGEKFVVLMRKTGHAIQQGSAKVYDSAKDAAEYAKNKAEEVFAGGGSTSHLVTVIKEMTDLNYYGGGSRGEGFYSCIATMKKGDANGKKFVITFNDDEKYWDTGETNITDCRVICIDEPMTKWDSYDFARALTFYFNEKMKKDATKKSIYDFIDVTKQHEDGGFLETSQDAVINENADNLDLQDIAYARGGKPDRWIDDAIQHPGRLRRRATREGLIHGDEKLSEADLHHLEKEGGATAKAAHLAETLRGFHAKGGVINQDTQLYKVKLKSGNYVSFIGGGNKFTMYYGIRDALHAAKLFKPEDAKIEKASPRYAITEGRSHTPFMYFETKEEIENFHKNPDVKIKIWEMKYEWGGQPINSGDVVQPIYAKGGKMKKGEKKQKYFLEYIMGLSTEDSYEQGEDPGTTRTNMDEVVNREFDSAKEVLEYLSKQYGFSDKTEDYTAFEDSRLDYSRAEDEDGFEVSPNDSKFKKFEKGETKLWAVNYSIYVYKFTKSEIPVAELAKDFGVKEYAEGGTTAEPVTETAVIPAAATVEAPVETTTEKIARIPNTEASAFTENRIPFIGNELVGKVLSNGDYLVLAFNVYPLWLYCAKEGKWYGNNDKPNINMSIQFSHSRPVHDATLISNAEMLTKVLDYAEGNYELGGLMVKQLFPMSTDNTGIAHSGTTNIQA